MSTEYRVVPVELLERITKDPMGMSAKKGHWGSVHELAELLSSTAPPAGGEHPTVCHRRFTTWIDQKTGGAMLGQVVIAEDFDALLCSHEDHRAHVTRLQAENEHLLGEHEDLLEKFNNLGGELDALKAELRSLRKELADTESDVETIAEHNIELHSELTKAHESALMDRHEAWKAGELHGLNTVNAELTKARECLKDIGVEWESVADIYQSAPAAPAAKDHDSDCSTNNRGVPELLGPCDCSLSKDDKP